MDANKEFESKLLKEDLYNINANKYAEKIKNVDVLIIWGSSIKGQMVYEYLREFNVENKEAYFADNNEKKWGTKWNGLLILSPREVIEKIEKNPNIYIIIGTENLKIREQLLNLGVNDNMIDLMGLGIAKDYLNFKKATPHTIIYSHLQDYKKAYSYLADDYSRKVYLNMLNSKISLSNEYLKGISDQEENQYFDKELINLNDKEVFCDCGSFNGDTLDRFIILSENKYKKYIAIEADKDIYQELNVKIQKFGYKNVETHNVACWNEKSILKFQSEQTAGHVSESGDISIQADTLDNIVKDLKVTFIKMDIEGAEEMALYGAERIIQENKPILAISIYHRLEDYYKIPLIIKNFNEDYKLYIRHYRDMYDNETICYAIPKERANFK